MDDNGINTETGEVVDVYQQTAIESITRAEIDIQVATAHRFPRSITQFKQEALAMATHDEETAASCFYKLTRKSQEGIKYIEGPGIRLAEIVGSAWGNMRYGARIVSEDATFITAQGIAHDLEKNVSSTIEVRRRITYKSGGKFNADMVTVTANAACSIALRNAIFKVVPKVFINSIYEAAKRVAIGDATTLIERRSKAVDHFKKMGVTQERLLSTLGKKGIEDIDLIDLEAMTGFKTAIKDGDMTVDEAFPYVTPDLDVAGAPETKPAELLPTEKKGKKKRSRKEIKEQVQDAAQELGDAEPPPDKTPETAGNGAEPAPGETNEGQGDSEDAGDGQEPQTELDDFFS